MNLGRTLQEWGRAVSRNGMALASSRFVLTRHDRSPRLPEAGWALLAILMVVWLGATRSAPTPTAPVEPAPSPIEAPALLPIAHSELVPEPRLRPATIELEAVHQVQRVGQPLELMARIRSADGAPCPGEAVEWFIEGSAFAHIECAPSAPIEPGTVPSPRFARGFSAAGESVSASTAKVMPGESRCVANSASPGDMRVTVRALHIDSTRHALAAMRIYWTNARARFPAKVVAEPGNLAMLATTVLEENTGAPLSGMRVRYSVSQKDQARFRDDECILDATSNAAGVANARLELPANAARTPTEVEARLLCPCAESGEPDLVIASARFEVTWQPVPEIRVEGPRVATIGDWVRWQARVVGLDHEGAKELRVELPPGWNSDPPAEGTCCRIALSDSAEPAQWALRCPSADHRVIPISLRFRDRTITTIRAPLEFTAARLTLAKRYPTPWPLGTPGRYEITVTNPGPVTARNIEITDEIPAGLHILKCEGLRRPGHLVWHIAAIPPNGAQTLRVEALPTQPLGETVFRAVATSPTATPAEALVAFAVPGPPVLDFQIRDRADPVSPGGELVYEVEVTNRGTGPADGVDIALDLAGATAREFRGPLVGSIHEGRIQMEPISQLEPGERRIGQVIATAGPDGSARLTGRLRHASLGSEGIIAEEATNISGE